MTIDLSKKLNNGDYTISRAIVSSYIVLMSQYIILSLFNVSGTDFQKIIQYIAMGIVGVLYLFAIPIVIKRSLFKFLSIFLIGALIYIISFLFNIEDTSHLNSIVFNLYFICIPTLIYTLSIKNIVILFKMIEKTAYIVFALGFMYASLAIIGVIDFGDSYMSFSYYMLLPTVVFMNKTFNRCTVVTLLLTLISLFILISFGARGPFIGIFAFLILKLIQPSSKTGNKLNYKKIIIIALLLLIIMFQKEILQFIESIIESFGIKSRTISLFLKNDWDLTGRDLIFKDAIDKISQKPILGWGLAGDRIASGRNDYIHNFYLEVYLNFGIIFGTILILIITYKMIEMIVKLKNINYEIFIILLVVGFFHLLVSSSYLIDFRFWIFAGALFNNNFRKQIT